MNVVFHAGCIVGAFFLSFLSFLSSFLPFFPSFLSFLSFKMSCHVIAHPQYRAFMDSLKTVPLEMRTNEYLADALGDFVADMPVGSPPLDEMVHAVFMEVIHYNNWPTNAPREPAPELEPIVDALWNYDVPNLSQIHRIWNNFPVAAKQIPNTNEFAVQWHKVKMAEWRDTRCDSHDEYEEYEDWCETRLFYALQQYSSLYEVLPPRNCYEVCVLRVLDATANTAVDRMAAVAEPDAVPCMDAEPEVAGAVSCVVAVVEPVAERQKTLKALNVLRSNDVSWERDGKIHTIRLHRQKAGVPRGACDKAATARVMAKLMPELDECGDCCVSLGRDGVLCVVTMY